MATAFLTINYLVENLVTEESYRHSLGHTKHIAYSSSTCTRSFQAKLDMSGCEHLNIYLGSTGINEDELGHLIALRVEANYIV